MTRAHRRTHLLAWLIVGPLALLVFIAGLLARRPMPVLTLPTPSTTPPEAPEPAR